MLSFLLESAARSLALGIVVWITLRLFRVQATQNRSLAWTAVLLSSVAMPLLMQTMAAVMASAPPATVAWIPAAASPLFLRPLAPALPAPPTAPSIDVATLASVVYLFIAGIFLLRVLSGLVRGRRLLQAATPLRESWTEGMDIRVSSNLAIPVTYGSTILFPPDWPEWSAFKRDAVLLHEQSHVRRRDFYVHLMADLHRAVLWFNPMAWWLQRELLELAEVACDDEAIRKVEDRVSYAEILVELAGKGSASGFAGVPMASGRTVERRVERMLREAAIAPRASLIRRALLVAALVPLVAMAAGSWHTRAETLPVTLPAALTLPQQTPPPAPAPPAVPASPAQQPARPAQTPERGNYLVAWPEQEVPGIIAREEGDAFRRLRTDEEREMFIQAFWVRRDPTPGTFDNEYREEYYRRIVQANEKFTEGVPGWKTDRGRIYIMHGPPDEIEAHAQGSTYIRSDAGGAARTITVPFIRWRYRVIEGLGNNIILEFVDTARDGNYRLQLDASLRGFFDTPAPPR